jgi:N-acetylglucosaminyldiphosphoundecaprenol N-acetyl-beta-D-mannosaminyltransferase
LTTAPRDLAVPEGGRHVDARRDAALASRSILGMRVDATSYDDATQRILDWAEARESRYVCIATVNNVMEAHDDASFLRVMNDADLTTPDGMPLVWGLRMLGLPATRVYGPDLTPLLLAAAAARGIPVGFFGGAPDVLAELVDRSIARFPGLEVAYAWSPPFRELSAEEEARVTEEITSSGARILLVGLGCPKQERWMHGRRGPLPCTMVGVGAAFDFIAGRKRQAPPALQRIGLEWLFRLVTEPRRLWRRYLRHNPRFVVLFGWQVFRTRFFQRAGGEPK